MARFFEMWVVLVLAGLAGLAVGRGVALSRRGVRIFPVDRQRSVGQGLADLAFVLAFLLWLYETLAAALPLPFHLVPEVARVRVHDSDALRSAGVLAMAGGLLVYGLALRDFGASWRLGIDRERAGELVTGGVFARSRNPVYLGLLLLAIGSFGALGVLALGALTALFALYFSLLIRREEAFLRAHYGETYARYTARVNRWWTWRRRPEAPPR
jgi:protein-S-isoprenylcysteine O-methyltransferase Ste14